MGIIVFFTTVATKASGRTFSLPA